eukprot:CAMPEP_0171241264 /NCGR_PEP_ID=MMETSP0790-20130122/44990_1 /TAXON_ID=2925 /ORGANISM="Alexandrium catenella, Strain OF101" /LENGTH=40 /DNA_ID= /DNA_START= /DNA_END= /DNA_ORIENTATION=
MPMAEDLEVASCMVLRRLDLSDRSSSAPLASATAALEPAG